MWNPYVSSKKVNNMTDHSKLFEGIKEFTKSRLIGTESPDKSYTFGEMLGGSAFARMCFNILKEQKVNPHNADVCASQSRF